MTAPEKEKTVDEQRYEATQMILANKPDFDLANLTEEEFELGLKRIKTRQIRMDRILKEVLADGVHFGNPLMNPDGPKDGPRVFPKPILLQPGAEELRNLFRLKLRHYHQAQVIETPAFCSVTVTLAVEDGAGRLLAPRTANCNTMEKRFEKRNGAGYIYKDAREMLHQCYTMAEKRAGILCTKEVTGANAFFAALDEDAMQQHLAGEAELDEPWTEEQKKKFYTDAGTAGIKTRGELEQLVRRVCPGAVGQKDLPRLYEALEQWKAEQSGGEK